MEDIKDIESSKIEEYLSKLGDWALNKGFQLVLAIICMYIGMKLSKLIVKMITQILQEIKHGGKCCIFSVIAD